jgi:hypothetical protein
MHLRCVCDLHRLTAPRLIPALLLGVLLSAAPSSAQSPPAPPTVGAGVQTSYVHDSPDGGSSTDRFLLDSVRLYVSGTAAPNIKYMFNTEYDGNNHINVLDAAAQFELSPKVNFWVGRMLPPSDRANLYGPYYSNEWATFTDGIQDGYPFLATGRDNGVLYWGQFDKIKLSGGLYDGPTTTGTTKVITAGRAQVDFWDAENGYYLNGTYYGAKNLLALGIAGQVQGSDKSAWNVDFLLEKKVPGGGAFTVESQYNKYSQLGGYNARYGESDGAYGLASYLFPPAMGMTGKFQLMGKYAQAQFTQGITKLDANYTQKTTELNVNYIIKDFNARIMLFYKGTRFDAVMHNDTQVGVGFQLQI